MTLWLWSRYAESMDFRAYDTVSHKHSYPGAQEGQPVDIGVAQLGVVPGKAPHIIPPAVADRVVGVHHVAVI